MKKALTVFAILLISSVPASAQNEEDAVMATVNRLFEGMKTADTAMVRSAFQENATLRSVGANRQTGEFELESSTSLDGFIGFIAQIEPGQAEEPIWDQVVQIDGNMATVWVKYELLFDGNFSHCGVDAFQLWKSAEGWKIFHLADTRRRENCWHRP